jgi:hypothetical protein
MIEIQRCLKTPSLPGGENTVYCIMYVHTKRTTPQKINKALSPKNRTTAASPMQQCSHGYMAHDCPGQ